MIHVHKVTQSVLSGAQYSALQFLPCCHQWKEFILSKGRIMLLSKKYSVCVCIYENLSVCTCMCMCGCMLNVLNMYTYYIFLRLLFFYYMNVEDSLDVCSFTRFHSAWNLGGSRKRAISLIQNMYPSCTDAFAHTLHIHHTFCTHHIHYKHHTHTCHFHMRHTHKFLI